MARSIDSDTTLQWYPPSGTSPPSAVALVLHGLNVNPSRMLPLVRELNGCGLAVLTCALSGHGANFIPVPGVERSQARLLTLGRVTYRLWRDEVIAACRIAALYAAQAGVPLVLVAFSLGGVMGCAAALASGEVRFARLVLFAPALSVRLHSKVLKLLAPWPQLVIPSATPAAYRANSGTTMAAYNALYAAQRDCERSLWNRLDVPALVFIDPQDELVSAPGLRRLAATHHLARWQFYDVHKSEGAQTRYHHLLIDADSVGRGAWAAMMARLREHLALDL